MTAAPAATLARQGLRVAATLSAVQNTIFAFFFLSFMNAYLLDELGVGASAPGYTLALYSAFLLASGPVAGALLDRVASRLVLCGAMLAQVAAVAVALATGSLAGFLVATALLAIGAGATWPLIYGILGATQPLEGRARAQASMSLVGYAATAFGVGGGISLTAVASAEAGLLTVGALALGPLLVARSPVVVAAGDRGEDASDPGAREAAQAADEPDVASAHGPRRFALIAFLHYGAQTSIAGIYGAYSLIELRLSLFEFATYLIPAGLAGLAALRVMPRISRPALRPRELSALFFAAGVGAVLLAIAETPIEAGVAAVPLLVGIAGIGPLLAATVLDLGRGANRALIVGSLLSIAGLGSVLVPAATAFAIDASGPRAGLAVVAGLFVLLVVLALTAPSHRGTRG